MADQFVLLENTGLRHVFEDGVFILSGNILTEDRRTYVVDNLWEIFHDAKVGLDVTSQGFGATIASPQALVASQTLSKLKRLLGSDSNPGGWQEKLPTMENVFELLKYGDVGISEKDRKEATMLLNKLVEALKRECGMS